jgi:hypothetical protein
MALEECLGTGGCVSDHDRGWSRWGDEGGASGRVPCRVAARRGEHHGRTGLKWQLIASITSDNS